MPAGDVQSTTTAVNLGYFSSEAHKPLSGPRKTSEKNGPGSRTPSLRGVVFFRWYQLSFTFCARNLPVRWVKSSAINVREASDSGTGCRRRDSCGNARPRLWSARLMDRRTRYGTPPGLEAEVPDMRGLYSCFVRVLLPGDLPVQPRYHKTLQRNSGLLEGTLHLRSPTDRVDVERPAAIVSGLCSGLRRICDVAANTLPSLEIDKDRFCRPSACS